MQYEAIIEVYPFLMHEFAKKRAVPKEQPVQFYGEEEHPLILNSVSCIQLLVPFPRLLLLFLARQDLQPCLQ